ncbi:MAG: hypothetical protein ACRC35_09330 [Angustibacter sp.]
MGSPSAYVAPYDLAGWIADHTSHLASGLALVPVGAEAPMHAR